MPIIGNNSMKLPPRKGREKSEESGREIEGVIICRMCKNIHYEKKWHHSGYIPGHLLKAKVSKKYCPACKMIKDHAFEGEIIIENIPADHSEELMNLVNSFGERAQRRDSQHRIIEAKINLDTCRVTTTENQLAVRLSKKIKDAFRKVDLVISHAPEPADVCRVSVKFHTDNNVKPPSS